jgi:peroxiredoxin Q/BCP
MITEGSALPELNLPDQDGRTRQIGDLVGPEGLVLYFYPKDDTPGCTVEAQDFERLADQFREKGYRVVGVSKDSAESHCRFREKYDLSFDLLVDEDAGYMRQVGAWGEKKMYGKTTEGVVRSTFVVDPEGNLEKVYRNVRAKGHAERVLRDL